MWDSMTAELLTTPLSLEPFVSMALSHNALKNLKKQILKAIVVLLGCKSRYSGAKFELISGQLLCSSDIVRTLRRGFAS